MSVSPTKLKIHWQSKAFVTQGDESSSSMESESENEEIQVAGPFLSKKFTRLFQKQSLAKSQSEKMNIKETKYEKVKCPGDFCEMKAENIDFE